jgi:WhiB family transcriptional regulator, redox-sensing transcriptional regulator
MSTSTAAASLARGHRPDRPDDAWRDGASWRDDAACQDADPELFFPGIRSPWAQVKTAKLICRSCPVTTMCLSWALASGQEYGIWGGLTEDERRRLHRRGRAL